MIPDVPVPLALRPYVAARVPYDVDFGAPGTHRGLPSTSVTFVLPLDDPLRVSWAGEAGSLHVGWSSLSGLHGAPASIHHDGAQCGVQLALTVRGARALLGAPAAALAGALTDLEEVPVPPAVRELPERLHAAGSWAERIALVDGALAAVLADSGARSPRAEVGRALAQLTRGVRVTDVADEVGYSRRRLTTLVRAECGLAPKEYQRIARFEIARRLVGRRPLADVAARCGYSDQAHLAREWAGLAGCTPTTWIREEFPFVQDPERGVVPGWDHD